MELSHNGHLQEGVLSSTIGPDDYPIDTVLRVAVFSPPWGSAYLGLGGASRSMGNPAQWISLIRNHRPPLDNSKHGENVRRKRRAYLLFFTCPLDLLRNQFDRPPLDERDSDCQRSVFLDPDLPLSSGVRPHLRSGCWVIVSSDIFLAVQ